MHKHFLKTTLIIPDKHEVGLCRLCLIYVCVRHRKRDCGAGRTKSVRADSGEHGRGLIAVATSVLEIRCQKFLGSLRTPAPAFHLPFFIFPFVPTSLPFLPPFSTSSECSTVALLTLIPCSSLLSVHLTACACIYVCDAKSQDSPTAI